MIQDSRYGAVEVQQLFKISPALNVYVKGACSGECTGESLLHIFNASFADDANTPSTAGFQPLLSNSSCNFSKCAFARVVTNTVEDQTLDAIPAQCSGGEVPKSSLPLPSCTGATASGAARTGTRYRQKQAWPD